MGLLETDKNPKISTRSQFKTITVDPLLQLILPAGPTKIIGIKISAKVFGCTGVVWVQ